MGLFGSILGGVASIIGGGSQKKAAKAAADAQVKAAQLAIDEQRRQFDTTQNNFQPYLGAGTGALDQINTLLGIPTAATQGGVDWAGFVNADPWRVSDWQTNHQDKTIDEYGKYNYDFDLKRGRAADPNYAGFDLSRYAAPDAATAQQGAIEALKASPLYSSLYRNGEQAILANGSATGKLRGGNMQGSLYNLGADTLSNVIQQQLSNLGGIANMGMGSAGQLGNFGANMANQVGAQFGNQGSARAGAALASGGINAGIANSVGKMGTDIFSAIFPNGVSAGGIKF